MPGLHVLARLKAGRETHDIPVVVVSADATQKQIDRLLTAGAVDCLTKPVDINRFLQIVQDVPAHAKVTEKESVMRRGKNALRKDKLFPGGPEAGSAEQTHLADA